MAIDFSVPKETQHRIHKVHASCDNVVRSSEKAIDDALDDMPL